MGRAILSRAVVLMAALGAGAPAGAIVIGGGGNGASDCLVALEVDANHPSTDPKQVRCIDGDPACDDDLTVDGICSLRVAVCANSTHDSACTVSGLSSIEVAHSTDNGDDPKFDPDFLALRQRIDSDFTFPVTGADACTGTVIFKVPIKGPLGNNRCGRGQKKLQLYSVSQPAAGPVIDKDKLKLACDQAPVNGCDPQTLYASTFDRIQGQIFNQSCARGGCHDSQSQAGGLLLETGASYNNLVDVAPSNPTAGAAGWLRVDPGQPATSFLLHKVEGDLPDSNYGVRMPRDGSKLKGTLREILRLWVEAGAPQDTWVPGTF